MEKRLLSFVCFCLILMTTFTVFISVRFPGIHNVIASGNTGGIVDGESVFGLIEDSDIPTDDSGIRHNLRLELPGKTKDSDIEISENLVAKTIDISIKGIDGFYLYEYSVAGEVKHIEDMVFFHDENKGTIRVLLDDVLGASSYIRDNFLYVDFFDPSEHYDKIVVLDAGHGGEDVGASSQGVLEKDINLAIMKKVYDKLSESDENIGVFCTRNEDITLGLDKRVELVNGINADLFVSIHQNSTSSGRISDVNGTEVLYNSADKTGRSKEFAGVILSSLVNETGSKNRGIVAGDDLLILRKSMAPAALVEVGFMTNRAELGRLNDSSYQQRAADGIVAAILENLK